MFTYLLLILIAIFTYFKLFKPLLYWRNRNIYYVSPFTRFFKVFLSPKPFSEVIRSAYDEHPTRRYYGSYQFLLPSLFVRDLDLIKQITVKDFEYFTDHLSFANSKADPILSANLFSLKGQEWREMRSMLSPAFTGSKMKAMYRLIRDTSEMFGQYFEQNENIVELEMKDFFEKYSNDIIANCAFGIEMDTLKDGTNEFFRMGKTFSTPNTRQVVKAVFYGLFPKFFEFFRIPALTAELTTFFLNIIKQTISVRETQNIIRPDMIHLLMEARKGRLKTETADTPQDPGYATVQEYTPSASSHLNLTDEMITAQALVFFLAGFTTSSTVLSFLSYELALNPDIQTRLQTEIDEEISKSENGQVGYEGLLKMKYLDQVVCETLRKWSPAFALNRLCVKDYVIQPKGEGEERVVIEKGCLVTVPVVGIHYDERYFPEAEKFKPERFDEEGRKRIVPGSYMPFGSGPRNCIGSRFALLEIKALTVSLLRRFTFVPIQRTEIPIKLAKRFTLESQNGVWLGLKKRN